MMMEEDETYDEVDEEEQFMPQLLKPMDVWAFRIPQSNHNPKARNKLTYIL